MQLPPTAGDAYVPNVRQGTLFFIAPELAQGGQLHPASDVYGFGVIMWELMMGLPVSVEACGPTRLIHTACAPQLSARMVASEHVSDA